MAYLRLRQICLVASDLAQTERQITDVLGLEICFRDPGVGKYGLHNALFAMGGTFLDQVDGMVVGGQADAVALQGSENVYPDVGVGRVVELRVLQPVAQDVVGVAGAEVHQHATGRRLHRDVWNAGVGDITLDLADDLARRDCKVDVEADAAPPGRLGLVFVAEYVVAPLHQLAVGENNFFAVAGEQGGEAPLDVGDLAGQVVNPDPVADFE